MKTNSSQSLREKLDATKREREQESATQVPGEKEQLEEGQLFSNTRDEVGTGPDYGYQRFRLHKNEELSAYTRAQDARYAMDGRMVRIIIMIIVTILVFFATLFIPNNIFNYGDMSGHDLAWFGRIASQNIGDFISLITTGVAANSYDIIVFTMIVMAFTGAALGATGACYQGALKNAMASPSTLGVMSGGTVGSVIYVLVNYSTEEGSGSSSGAASVSLGDLANQVAQLDVFTYIYTMFGQAFCSLIGCFIVVGLVMTIARLAGHGKVSNTALIISGQVFATLATSVITVVRYYLTVTAPDSAALESVQNLQNGSVSATTNIIGVLIVIIPIAICLAFLFGMCGRLNILAFSDEEARSMGINTNRTRNIMVGLCTLITAIVVSFCGSVGYVGFMVPLIVRRIIGSDFRYVVPASALAGAIMMMVTYFLTTLNFPGVSAGRGLGMFTSIIGSIVFIITVIRQRRSANVDWV